MSKVKTLNKLDVKKLAHYELIKRGYNKKSLNLEALRKDPLLYFQKRFDIDPRLIKWSLFDEYKNHKWDGTPDPFFKIIEALQNNKWVGVESAVGTGKTFFGALLVFWFLECHKNSIVVTTAPKQEQLSLHIWKEISKLFPQFNKGSLSHLRLRMVEGSEEWSASGFTAGVKAEEDSSTKAQGFHSEHLLFILEETPGIPISVLNAFQNTCTAPHNLIVAFGNPDNNFDPLHRFCLQENVEYVRISGYDHPNVVLNNPMLVPGAASKEGLNRILKRYGRNSPLYLSRARGISPKQSIDSLIMIDWCIEAKDNKREDGPYALGVDPANSKEGDKAAIALGKGNSLISVDEIVCEDSNKLAKNHINKLLQKYNILPQNIGVDGVGIGAGTVNALKEMHLQVINILGSASPLKAEKFEKFKNLRSQIYWQLREDIRNKAIVLPDIPMLFAELTSINWHIENDKIIIEAKDDIKRRIGKSPNLADAVAYWNWVRVRRKKLNNISVY